MTTELKPCPFCGAGETTIKENGKVWTGMKYSDPVSVSVLHWCEEVEGQPSRMIERVGRDLESAIAAWNRREACAKQAGAVDWRHIANEWADELCNAHQGVRNVIDGIYTPEKALQGIRAGFDRCQEVQQAEKDKATQPAASEVKQAGAGAFAYYTDWHPDGRKYAEKPHGFDELGVHLSDLPGDPVESYWHPLYTEPKPAASDGRAVDVQFLRDVIALCSHRGASPSRIEGFDPEDKWIADLWRTAQAKLSETDLAEHDAKGGA